MVDSNSDCHEQQHQTEPQTQTHDPATVLAHIMATWQTWETRSMCYKRRRQKSSSGQLKNQLATCILTILVLLECLIAPVAGLRCYVCGGVTGRPCEEIASRRRSPYVRPRPILTSDGQKQWEECNDLINNKGCIKQVVNEVVLLRACWMQGTHQCLEDGDATVCTCKEDLCNYGSRTGPSSILVTALTLLLVLTRSLWWSLRLP